MSSKLVIDTNLLLHYRPLAEMDWNFLSTNVEIVIARVVVSELDKHKYSHPVDRIRRRAERVLREFNEIIDLSSTEIRKGVGVSFLSKEPSVETFAANNLDPGSADDRLIATALELRHAGSKVLIATADTGLKLNARVHGLDVVCPPDEQKLPVEPDPREKELLELKRQLAVYKAREPLLDVIFDDTGKRYTKISRPPAMQRIDKGETLRQVMATSPQIQRRPRIEATIDAATIERWVSLGDEKYNEALTVYYKAYDRYLNKLENFRRINYYATEIKMQLRNTGNGVADDIHVFITFPSGASLLLKDDFPRKPHEPMAPDKNKFSPFGGSYVDMDSIAFMQMSPQGTTVAGALTLAPEASGGIVATFEVNRLKQQMVYKLHGIYYMTDSSVSSLSVKYLINTGSASEQSEGELNIIITDQ